VKITGSGRGLALLLRNTMTGRRMVFDVARSRFSATLRK
jgi:hypothetical protein